MKMISKKIALYIMVGMLSVAATLNAYSLGVHATGFEWVGGAIAFEEAIKWLLASVGIVSAGGMTADYWEQHGDEFVDYCTEQNITNTEVAEWQMKLCQGILDKGSACWSAFKSWAKSLVSSSSGGGGSSDFSFNIPANASISDCIVEINDFFGLSTTIPDTGNFIKPLYNLALRKSGNTIECFSFYNSNSFDAIGNVACDSSSVKPLDTSGCYYLSFYYNPNRNIWAMTNGFLSNNSSIPFSSNYTSYFTNNIDTTNFTNSYYLIGFGSSVADSDFVGLQGVDQTTLDVIDSDLPDENASEVTIPMPGVADSDNTASANAYDDIVDLINDGTITIDDGLERIQGLLKIITYDTVTDDVIPIQPDPDTGENKKKDDVVNENKDNMAFTLGGLETVFPFCIPWDIYAFLSILEAEPEAPKFNFPFRDPTTHQDVFYEVDLSVFEPVAVVTRYGADLIFIIGLALATRKLIGAGGGD